MRIAVPDLVSNSYFPALAAVELGYFQAQGIDMDLEMLSPAGRTMEALRDGDVDFVAGPAVGLSRLAGRQVAGRFVPIYLLAAGVAFRLGCKALGVKPGDVEAVKGLRIGAAPGPDAALRRLLAEAGIDPARDGVALAPVPGAGEPGVSFGVHAAQVLEEGTIDGFWANAMGAEVSVRSGIGSVVLDPRQGLGPSAARDYTFPALVTTDRLTEEAPDVVEGAARAIVGVQRALRNDPSRATEVGQRLFPPDEAELIEDLVRRDTPYYTAGISPNQVASLNEFSRNVGLLSGDAACDVAYEQVVASRFAHIWSER